MPSLSPELRIYCFIDALGWQLSQHYGFLPDLLPSRSRLETLLGYSCTCDPSILTGKLPQEHGHFSFFYYQGKRSPLAPLRHLRWLPRWLTSRGRVRHWLSRLVGRALGYTGYFQLYNVPFDCLPWLDYSEKRDIYQPGGILGGQATFLDHWRASGQNFHLSNWRHSEEANLKSLRQAIESPQPPARAYLYLASMDAILHRDGTRSPAVESKLRWYEDQLRSLWQLAQERYARVTLEVFSDHGMTDVRQALDLLTPLRAFNLSYGKDYVAVLDSTMGRFWFLTERARSLLLDWLGGLSSGRLLEDEQLRQWGCFFPDRRYGEAIFLADPGVLLCPGHLGEKPLAGMHGYDPEHPDSPGFFGSTEKRSTFPRGLTDLYEEFVR